MAESCWYFGVSGIFSCWPRASDWDLGSGNTMPDTILMPCWHERRPKLPTTTYDFRLARNGSAFSVRLITSVIGRCCSDLHQASVCAHNVPAHSKRNKRRQNTVNMFSMRALVCVRLHINIWGARVCVLSVSQCVCTVYVCTRFPLRTPMLLSPNRNRKVQFRFDFWIHNRSQPKRAVCSYSLVVCFVGCLSVKSGRAKPPSTTKSKSALFCS